MTGNILEGTANGHTIGNTTNDFKAVYARALSSNAALGISSPKNNTTITAGSATGSGTGTTVTTAGTVTVTSYGTATYRVGCPGLGAVNYLTVTASGATTLGNSNFATTINGNGITANAAAGAVSIKNTNNTTGFGIAANGNITIGVTGKTSTLNGSTITTTSTGATTISTTTTAGTITFKPANTARWIIDKNGHFVPNTTNQVNLGATNKYVAQSYITSANTANAIISTSMAVPTAAPASPMTGKVYLWFSNTGQYDE
jgi:hypothetical protein